MLEVTDSTIVVDVGGDQEFVHGTIVTRIVDRRDIGIVRWHDHLYAVRLRCPHQQGPLGRGVVFPRLMAGNAVGTLTTPDSPPVVSCPWHGWEFDLDTGVALCDPSMRVAAYRVTSIAGRVLLHLDSKRRQGTVNG